MVKISEPSSVAKNETTDISAISIYPNPLMDHEQLTIRYQVLPGHNQISLYNALGQEVSILHVRSGDDIQQETVTFNLPSQLKGIHFVKITNSKGSTTHKLLIN